MARVKGGPITHLRHKKIVKMAEGQFGAKHRLFRRANEAMLHSLWYAYRDRRTRKRDLRRLWILRINAACRSRGTRYSRFINGLQRAEIQINRKMLAHLAVIDPGAFDKLVELAQQKQSVPA